MNSEYEIWIYTLIMTIIVILIFMAFSNTTLETFSTNEAISNIASLYNSNNFTVSNINVTSSLNVAGTTNLKGELTNLGNAKINGNITNNGNTSITGNLSTNGNATIKGSLIVGGRNVIAELDNIKKHYIQDGSPIGIQSSRGGFLQDAGGWVQDNDPANANTGDWALLYARKVYTVNGTPVVPKY